MNPHVLLGRSRDLLFVIVMAVGSFSPEEDDVWRED